MTDGNGAGGSDGGAGAGGEVPVDAGPAARELARVAERVEDAALGRATPCARYDVRDLVRHVLDGAAAFRDAAGKQHTAYTDAPPEVSTPLPDDWRARLPRRLDELAAALREPAAWRGETRVAGIGMPAGEAALTGLDEIVVHGWDLARATGQPYTGDERALRALLPMLERTADPAGVPGLFGPAVSVPRGAPLLDRVLALTGRDPGWCAA
ncbi:TIGR03086 family metal-binding protein [Streptomyces cacaoi]|uniref:TIGR03086 family metal-binding protein n=1 Tax=Streptomyces cacaoi TaxID=1898 RepID=UPI002629848F|nr:TIGR03086 family metal-binding protein [Streptomyces cacaoi]